MPRELIELNFLLFESFTCFLENELPKKYTQKKEFIAIKNLLELHRKASKKAIG